MYNTFIQNRIIRFGNEWKAEHLIKNINYNKYAVKLDQILTDHNYVHALEE